MLHHRTLARPIAARLKPGVILAFATVLFLYATASALAVEPVYFVSTTGEYPTTVTSTVSEMTVLEGGEDSVSCKKSEFTAKLTEGSEQLTITPSYKECTGNIHGVKSAATVTPGSCKIELSKDQEVEVKEGEVKEVSGDEAIGPSTCGSMIMEDPSSKCTFEVPHQGPATGGVNKPEGEKGMVITAKITKASVSATAGCEVKGTPTWVIQLIVNGVWKLYQEIVSLRLHFWIHEKEVPVGQQFNPKERVKVELRNPYNVWSVYEQEMRDNNKNWKFFNIAGEPASVTLCYSVFYFPKGSCRFELEAPATKGEKIKIEVWGRFFKRGEINNEVV